MNIATNLRKKGIIVTEYVNKGNELRNKWIEAFLEFTNEKTPYHHFLWELIHHYFTAFREKKLLERKEATEAFEKIYRQYCYIFFQESNYVLQVEFASAMKARDLFDEDGNYRDVYIVDKGFNWTYVIPHEDDYGPYFYRKGNQH